MNIHPIKAFSDNYIWLIEASDQVVVVDPGEAEYLIAYLEENTLDLVAILLTHNHDDHIGGVVEILENYPDTPIYGPEETSVIADHIVEEGNSFDLLKQTFQVMKTAGHTKEHISYLMGDTLFCGDALFSGGCGRVFTGDYQAQFDAMQKFKKLADDVKVCAGHEYTETNLRFAQTIEPENQEISKALEETEKLRAKDQPTLPSTIGKEKKINLFMRAETVEEFTKLRDGRDQV